MEERVLLVDSDIFILLAAAGVLERVAHLLGVKLENVRRLKPLKYQLEKSSGFKRKYPEPIRNLAAGWCDRVAALDEEPLGRDILDRLNVTKGIDEGEGLLFALLSERPFYYLASGDKRGMVAVATAPELADIRSAVAGRIICLETVLGMLIREDGPDAVKAAFVPLCTCNKSLTVFFSETDCLEAVHSYFNDLVRQTGEGFLMVP